MGIWQHTWECDGLVCATEVAGSCRESVHLLRGRLFKSGWHTLTSVLHYTKTRVLSLTGRGRRGRTVTIWCSKMRNAAHTVHFIYSMVHNKEYEPGTPIPARDPPPFCPALTLWCAARPIFLGVEHAVPCSVSGRCCAITTTSLRRVKAGDAEGFAALPRVGPLCH